MWDFIAQLFFDSLGELIPRRVTHVLVMLTVLIAGLAFVALAGFCAFELAVHGAEPTIAIVIAVCLGLAGVCVHLLRKGLQR